MAIFGRGLSPGIVATPEQEEWSRRMGAMFPNAPQSANDTAPAPQTPQPSKWQQFASGLARVGEAFHTDPSVLQNYDKQQQDATDEAQRRILEAQRPQQQWAMWLAQQQYEAAHPKPGADEQLAVGAGLVPGSPEYQKMLHDLLIAKTDPYVATTLPNDHFYAGPRSGLGSALGMGAANGPPAAAIQALQANPALRAQFEQKYGAGSSARYLGGGAGNGTGGFRNIPSGNPLYP